MYIEAQRRSNHIIVTYGHVGEGCPQIILYSLYIYSLTIIIITLVATYRSQ